MARKSRRVSNRRTIRRSRHSTRRRRHTRGGGSKPVYWIPSSSKPVSKKVFNAHQANEHAHNYADGPNVPPSDIKHSMVSSAIRKRK